MASVLGLFALILWHLEVNLGFVGKLATLDAKLIQKKSRKDKKCLALQNVIFMMATGEANKSLLARQAKTRLVRKRENRRDEELG
jgi:hypothetical protein